MSAAMKFIMLAEARNEYKRLAMMRNVKEALRIQAFLDLSKKYREYMAMRSEPKGKDTFA